MFLHPTRRSLWRRAAYAALLIGATAACAVSQGSGFPLRVLNNAPVDRVNEPVATGIPVPYNAPVFHPNHDLMVVDQANNPVPAQFKVLSRWFGTRDDGTKVPKWLLVEFLADVPAGGFSYYFLRAGPRTPGLVTTQTVGSELRISTGAALFTLDKTNFSIFKRVNVGGSEVLAQPAALEIRDVAGAPVTTQLLSTVVEEQGDVRTVVRQKGKIPALGLDFTVRSFFWTGRTEVKVDFRLENNGNYGEGITYMGPTSAAAHFEDLKLTLKVADVHASPTTTTLDRGTWGAPYALAQSFGTPSSPTNMLSGCTTVESLNGQTVGTGQCYEGAMALNGTGGSVLAVVDRFWQNFPKAFDTVGNAMSVGLWPAFGGGPIFRGQYATPTTPAVDPLSVDFYRLDGGRWKTHTLSFDFAPTVNYAPADVAAAAHRVANPMVAVCPPEWYSQCFAFGSLVMERRAWFNPSHQRFERQMDVLAHDAAADYQDSLGKVGLPLFRNRGGTYGGDQMFGWENFGDITWGDGYSSLHYDLSYGVLINLCRTGDYGFFDMARDMVAHRRDYDQYHSTSTASARRGGQFYEKGWTHGNYTAPAASHTWVHGLLLSYALTGDEGAREAAIEVGGFVQRMHPETWDGWWGSRILGWQLEALVHLFDYVGDTQYITLAQATAHRFETLEIQWGMKGYVPNPAWTNNVHEQTWMHCIVYSALGKYYFATFDQSILPLMDRMGDWILSDMVKQLPSGPSNSRTLGIVWGRAADTYHADPSTHHLWVAIDALSYGALALGKPEYTAAATSLWECVTRYHQEQASSTTIKNYDSPSTFSKIAFRMQMYPNAETKIMSNIALWGQAYPMMKAIWDGTW